MSNPIDDKLKPYLDKYQGITGGIERLPISQRRKALLGAGVAANPSLAFMASAIGPVGTVIAFLIFNFAVLVLLNRPDTDAKTEKGPP